MRPAREDILVGMHLVICIGNEARGDDGVARLVGRGLAAEAGMRVLSEPQLDVLMAEEIAAADRVTFVDAERREEPPVRVEPIGATSFVPGATTHALDPAGLLALASALYAAAPPARLVTLAAPAMGHGDELSPVAAQAADEALRLLRG